MGLVRAIFRIGKQPDEEDDTQTPIQYPPEDKLSFSYEEILVTLTLLIISYFILAKPWTRRRRNRLNTAWGYELWVNTLRQVRHVKSIADLKLLWYELKESREQQNNANNQQQQRDELLRQSRNNNSQNNNSTYDMDKTIRATGGSKRSLGTPLRPFFRPLSKESLRATQHKIHPSTFDGNLLSSPSHLKQRFTTASSQGNPPSGTTNKNTDDINNREQSFTYEDFGPKQETDHDRFQKAWQTQIRFAEYKQLVLPPTCKLVEFNNNPICVNRLKHYIILKIYY